MAVVVPVPESVPRTKRYSERVHNRILYVFFSIIDVSCSLATALFSFHVSFQQEMQANKSSPPHHASIACSNIAGGKAYTRTHRNATSANPSRTNVLYSNSRNRVPKP
jgi:hypothetical protein